MNHRKTFFHHLQAAALCLLAGVLFLSGCGAEEAVKPEIQAAPEPVQQEAVRELRCTQPTSFSTFSAVSEGEIAVNSADYEKACTTLQIVDIKTDSVSREITLEGIWDLKEQAFSDGRITLCSRETNTWKFLTAELAELGTWSTESMDGFFSCDGSTYYYLADRVLFQQDIASGRIERVALPLDLRLQELTAFDARSGTLLMQFLLSPYSSECGTAAFDVEDGTLTMLQDKRYQVSFCGEDLCMLSFDNDKMGYSVLYSSGGEFHFGDAGIFSDTDGYLFAISGSPYLMGIGTDRSVLYATGPQISSCALEDWGINGEMHSVCFLPDEALLVGAVYSGGAFHLYAIDPAQLSFTAPVNAAPAESPLRVDENLAHAYWNSISAAPLDGSLQDARQYADTLEEKYGVHILLSSQCKDAAALCDHAVSLTDTLAAEEELSRTLAMLEALDRSLALYPEGFPAQFQNSVGDGGLCFLLVGQIETDYGAVGCTYERYEWQYIALDIRQTWGLDSIICHEIWHATENHIFSLDYTAFPIDEWEALNPPDFTYYMDATQTDPEQKWTLYNSAPEEVHFVDSYACVDIKEDRARIMEYFMTRDDEAALLIQSSFIRQKLQIMCDAVRSAFDTAGWENVRWERLL